MLVLMPRFKSSKLDESTEWASQDYVSYIISPLDDEYSFLLLTILPTESVPGGSKLGEAHWKSSLSWNTEVVTKPSLLALVILVASILCRCTRYVTQKPETDSDKVPPWALDSEVSSNQFLPLTLGIQTSGILDRQQVGLLIFGKMLFHLCHCLVNHPFIICVRLRPFATKVPVSFSLRLLQVGREHACQLLDTVREAREAGYEIESSFTAYSIAVAGGIHSIAAHHEQRQAAAQGHHTQEVSVSLRYYKESVGTLDRLAEYWVLASNTAIRLREFHQQSAALIDLLDPTASHEEVDPSTSQILWSIIDYRTLGERSPKSTPSIGSAPDAQQFDWNIDPSLSMPTFPSSDSNVLAGGASDQLLSFEEADLRILKTGVVTPVAQLDEIDHLLGASSTRYPEMLI
ncbi:hypothetical protein BJY01DRAFT_253713 [Aspergillus pseudoustus]|uniref:Transcription factor domain-containing protein n=1 Tax=Aspergillus pseudoustus TaxID=1810923 RepID=A0ABR4J170_9EURO